MLRNLSIKCVHQDYEVASHFGLKYIVGKENRHIENINVKISLASMPKERGKPPPHSCIAKNTNQEM